MYSGCCGNVEVLGMRVRTRLFAVVFLALAAWLIPGSPVLAKGPVDKITLTGPGLTNPIEFTDPESLAPFNPWTRGFIDWSRGLVTEPPQAEQTYAVAFYLKASERPYCLKHEGEFCLIYLIRYSPDPSGGPGYLYFPGQGEPEHQINKGTIIDSSIDAWDPNGKWQYATAGWDALMQRALQADGGPTSTSASPATRAISPANLWVLALAAMGLLAAIVSLLWLRLRQKPT